MATSDEPVDEEAGNLQPRISQGRISLGLVGQENAANQRFLGSVKTATFIEVDGHDHEAPLD